MILYNLPTAFAPAAQQLRMIGVEPRVQVVVDGFLPMPFLVAGTDRVALLQEHLARRIAGVADIRILPCPFEVVPLAEAFWWHPMHRADPAHAWLRKTLREIGHRVAGAPGPGMPAGQEGSGQGYFDLVKAAVHTSYGSADVVRVADVPRPTPRAGDVLIKVVATTVNRTDCAYRAAKPFFVRTATGLRRPRRHRASAPSSPVSSRKIGIGGHLVLGG